MLCKLCLFCLGSVSFYKNVSSMKPGILAYFGLMYPWCIEQCLTHSGCSVNTTDELSDQESSSVKSSGVWAVGRGGFQLQASPALLPGACSHPGESCLKSHCSSPQEPQSSSGRFHFSRGSSLFQGIEPRSPKLKVDALPSESRCVITHSKIRHPGVRSQVGLRTHHYEQS